METIVGVKEFRANLPSYLDSPTPVVITRHGETIGYFIPAHRGKRKSDLDALRDAAANLESMMSALKISEDDIAADFKIRRTNTKK